MAADRQEQIEQQLGLLERHRTTLAHYLRQQAQLGTAHTSPGVTHGIIEARQNIQRVKQTLRAWNGAVEDHPDDEALPENTNPIELKKSYGRPRILVVWVAIAAAMALIGVVGLVILLAGNNSFIG